MHKWIQRDLFEMEKTNVHSIKQFDITNETMNIQVSHLILIIKLASYVRSIRLYAFILTLLNQFFKYFNLF